MLDKCKGPVPHNAQEARQPQYDNNLSSDKDLLGINYNKHIGLSLTYKFNRRQREHIKYIVNNDGCTLNEISNRIGTYIEVSKDILAGLETRGIVHRDNFGCYHIRRRASNASLS